MKNPVFWGMSDFSRRRMSNPPVEPPVNESFGQPPAVAMGQPNSQLVQPPTPGQSPVPPLAVLKQLE